jgi:hypothetical protein
MIEENPSQQTIETPAHCIVCSTIHNTQAMELAQVLPTGK